MNEELAPRVWCTAEALVAAPRHLAPVTVEAVDLALSAGDVDALHALASDATTDDAAEGWLVCATVDAAGVRLTHRGSVPDVIRGVSAGDEPIRLDDVGESAPAVGLEVGDAATTWVAWRPSAPAPVRTDDAGRTLDEAAFQEVLDDASGEHRAAPAAAVEEPPTDGEASDTSSGRDDAGTPPEPAAPTSGDDFSGLLTDTSHLDHLPPPAAETVATDPPGPTDDTGDPAPAPASTHGRAPAEPPAAAPPPEPQAPAPPPPEPQAPATEPPPAAAPPPAPAPTSPAPTPPGPTSPGPAEAPAAAPPPPESVEPAAPAPPTEPPSSPPPTGPGLITSVPTGPSAAPPPPPPGAAPPPPPPSAPPPASSPPPPPTPPPPTAPPPTAPPPTAPPPTGPPADAPPPPGAPSVDSGLGEHDGLTVGFGQGTDNTAGQRPPPPPLDTARQVQAVYCAHRHPNPVTEPTCRVCGQPIIDRTAVNIPRPVVACMVFESGLMVDIDRPQLIGRRPAVAADAGGEIPNLVALPSPDGEISRQHLSVKVEGWDVLVEDLGSTNGSELMRPGQPMVRLRSHEPTLVTPGSTVILAGTVRFTLTHPDH